MATVKMDLADRKEWPLASPWLWLGGGVLLTAWSVAWTLIYRPDAAGGRIIVLAFGLLAASVGVCLRHRDRQTSYVRERVPGMAAPLRFLMGVVFGLVALGATVLVVLAFMGRTGTTLPALPACFVWITVTPLFVGASLCCLRRKPGQPLIETDEEIGLAFFALAGCCLLGTMTLIRDPNDPEDWDSMRMMLRVGTFLSGYAAALIVSSTRMRRLMLSVVFVLHFMGISTAALAAPPAPWIVTQSWLRVFRPYLEFMYLNNAYHFYAPDPGPSSFLWFRIIYKDANNNEFGKWYKLPEMDTDGRIKHPVALEYQRYLSMSEQIAAKDALPSEFIFDKNLKQYIPNPMFFNRLKLAEPGPPVVIAGVPLSPHPRIPLHPNIAPAAQVNIPATAPKYLLSSFARHIAHKFPTHVDDQGKTLKFKSVKIYRVIHQIPAISWYQYRLSPNDPVLYQPYYMGNYLEDGSQLIDSDPYLYWMLPILRDQANNPDSKILDYCRRHAGDTDWQMQRSQWK